MVSPRMMTPSATRTSGRRRASAHWAATGISVEPGTRVTLRFFSRTPARRSPATTCSSRAPTRRSLYEAATTATLNGAPETGSNLGKERLTRKRSSNGNLLHDFEAIAVEADDLAGAVRKEPDFAQSQGHENLRSDPIVPKAHRREFARPGVEAADDVCPAVGVLHIKHRAAPRLRDRLEGAGQRPMGVEPPHPEDVAQEVLPVHADEGRLRPEGPHRERQMVAVVELAPEAVQ